MESNMPAPWRLAVTLTLVVALPLHAQHNDRRTAAEEFNNMGSRIDTTVALTRGALVDLSSFNGDITVSTWDRDEVKIHATSRGRLRLDSSPSRVSLVESPYRGDYEDDNNHFGYEITMPKSARLLARSVSGDMRLRDVSDIESHTVSGDIQVTNIANRANLETVSGDVTATKVGAGLRANSVSGDIHAKSISGEIAGQSVSGDIVLDDVSSSFIRTETVSGEIHFSGPVDPKGRYEFHSHSGDIDLGLTSGGNDATLYVETYSGDLDSGCSMTLQPGGSGSRMGKRGTFTLGNGGGAHFSIQTFSGDVHITGCRSHGEK
jgi:hypothetical protein